MLLYIFSVSFSHLSFFSSLWIFFKFFLATVPYLYLRKGGNSGMCTSSHLTWVWLGWSFMVHIWIEVFCGGQPYPESSSQPVVSVFWPATCTSSTASCNKKTSQFFYVILIWSYIAFLPTNINCPFGENNHLLPLASSLLFHPLGTVSSLSLNSGPHHLVTFSYSLVPFPVLRGFHLPCYKTHITVPIIL